MNKTGGEEKNKHFRINTFTEYRKVLNTVPTLGGVKSAFHEAKQESIINYESNLNRQSMMKL